MKGGDHEKADVITLMFCFFFYLEVEKKNFFFFMDGTLSGFLGMPAAPSLKSCHLIAARSVSLRDSCAKGQGVQ